VKKYSEAELELFQKLQVNHLVNHLEPPAIYRVAVEEAFLLERKGKEIDALRRGAKALLINGKPYRLTPEFDALVEVK
jgi:predicted Ser/Thr protein kinase